MADRAADYLRARVDAWRSGSAESQAYVAIFLVCLIAASFVLPYFAVVIANAGNHADPQGPDPFASPTTLELGSTWEPGAPLADDPRHHSN